MISAVITPTTNTSVPIAEKTISSNAVVSLKWEGTPRQVCMEIRKTSPSDARLKMATTSQPARRLGRRNPRSHVTVSRVIPKDRPNTIGLRQDSGPVQAPPSTR